MKNFYKNFILILFIMPSVLLFACGKSGDKSYKLNFIVDNEIYYTVKTHGEEQISINGEPNKDGYVFDGWYFDENYTQKFSYDYFLNKELTKNVNVYAKFTIKEYTITYILDGGENGENPLTYNIEDNTIVLKPATKNGFKFDGWYTDSTFENRIYSIQTGSYGNLTLFAKYSNELYPLTIVNGEVVNTMWLSDGSEIILNNPDERTGHTFKGWYLDSEGNNKFNLTQMPQHGITIYAIWEADEFSITFVTNCLENLETIKLPYGTTYNKPKTPNNKGYKFEGWYLDNITFNNKYEFSETNTIKNENIVVYAKWKLELYNITYYLDEGVNDQDNPNTYTIESETITLKDATKTGYTFNGWYSDGTFNNKVEHIAKGSVGDLELYAKFTLNEYTITFNSNGGSLVPVITEKYLANIQEPEQPTKPGYKFEGWFLDNETFENKFEFTTMPINGANLYAKWLIVDNTITYYLDEGVNDQDNPNTYTVESETITLKDATKTGYSFSGWYSDSAFNNKVEHIAKGSVGNLELYAKFTAKTYTVALNANGGECEQKSVEVMFDSEYSKLPTPSRSGYTFVGWYNGDILIENEKWIYDTNEIVAKWSGVFLVDSGTIVGLTESGKATKNIVIPAYIDGEEIKNIQSDVFTNNEFIENVDIQIDLQLIDTKMFNNCTALRNVNLPNTVISIGNEAFKGCTSLEEITLPKALKIIGLLAFYDCFNLKTVYYNCKELNHLQDYSSAFSGNNANYAGINLIIGKDVKIIPNNLFKSSNYLVSVIFDEDSVCEEIGEYAFDSCTNLSYLELSKNIKTISYASFYNCSIDGVQLPNELQEIRGLAFASCLKLKNVVIPCKVSTIGGSAFSNCVNLETVTFENDEGTSLYAIKTLGPSVFGNCSKLRTITIPSSVEEMGSYLFNNCLMLNSVKFENSAESLPIGMFENCSSLKNVEFPKGLKVIEDSCFSNCNAILNISIPYGVQEIKKSAFINCSTLLSIELPSTISVLGDNVFANCANILSIELPSNLESIGAYAFSSCANINAINLPSSLKTIGSYAFSGCNSISQITLPENLINIGSKTISNMANLKTIYYNAVNATIDGLSIIASNVYNVDVIVGNKVEVVPEYFLCDTPVKSISFEEGSVVKTIGSCAFRGFSKYKSIVIPSTVTKIGSSVFEGWDSLEELTIPVLGDAIYNSYNYTTLGYMFGATTYDKNILEVPQSLKRVVLTNTEKISQFAFYNCSSIEEIALGENLKEIGEYAFFGCSNLNRVEITNLEKWFKIKISNIDSNPLSSAEEFVVNGEIVTDLVIPETIEEINKYTIFGSFNSIKIHKNVLSISSEAFRCSLTEGFYCDMLNKPASWQASWNYGNNVYWLFEANPHNNGYKLEGYYSSSEFIEENRVSIPEKDEYRNYQGYANWSLEEYSINYVLNNGNNHENNPDSYIAFEEVVLYDAYKEGYNFVGWYDNAEFANSKIETFANLTGDITLYACFKLIEEGDIYYINSKARFIEYSTSTSLWNKDAVVLNDIDLEDMEISPIGTEEKPYSATFDGNGFSFKNFKITETRKNNGLFGYIKDSTIKNVRIENFNIKQSTAEQYNVGLLVASCYNCEILNCYANGTITITECPKTANFGGLMGKIEYTIVANSHASANINIENVGSKEVNYYVGGFVGKVYSGSISYSYSAGDISLKSTSINSSAIVGGFVGYMEAGSCNECFSITNISAKGVKDSASRFIYGGALAEFKNTFSCEEQVIECANKMEEYSTNVSKTDIIEHINSSWDSSKWNLYDTEYPTLK